MGEIYGYVRVSCRDQNADRQMIAMKDKGIPEENIYVEKQSGKDFNRPMYKRMIRKLKTDDLLYIKSIDRLGRNYQAIIEQWRLLTKEKNVDIVVMDMPLLDTRRGKDLMGTLIADLVLALLSYVSENERYNIRSRQREGIDAAKQKGVRFGRPPIPVSEDFERIYDLWISKAISAEEAAKQCGLTKSTFYYRVRKRQNVYTKAEPGQ